MDRNEAIDRIRKGLRRRSGKAWSVTGGRGTAWGWIKVEAPPRRRTWRFRDDGTEYDAEIPQDYGHMGPADREELGKLLSLERPSWNQGESIPASTDYYLEYVARAEGNPPGVYGVPYWD